MGELEPPGELIRLEMEAEGMRAESMLAGVDEHEWIAFDDGMEAHLKAFGIAATQAYVPDYERDNSSGSLSTLCAMEVTKPEVMHYQMFLHGCAVPGDIEAKLAVIERADAYRLICVF